VTKRELAAAPGVRWSTHPPIVLTRPFGATFDLLTKPLDHGGLKSRHGRVFARAGAILAVLVA